MANRIIAWQYTSRNGTLFSTGVNAELAAQEDGNGAPLIGGQALPSNHTLPPLPRQMKPRRAVVADAAGYVREVLVASTTSALNGTAPPTVTVEDSDGAAHVCTVQEVKGESFRKRKQQAA